MEKLQIPLYKRYVNVIAECDRNGKLTPIYLRWENNALFKIDKIIEVRKAGSIVGGSGLLYRIVVQGQTRHLFYEINRWFIESYTP